MKRSTAALLIVLIATPVAAATKSHKAMFMKAMHKVAPADYDKSKSVCICFDSGFQKRAGRLVQRHTSGNLFINCRVPNYDSFGVRTSVHECADFEVAR
jgi:hypothetical protein